MMPTISPVVAPQAVISILTHGSHMATYRSAWVASSYYLNRCWLLISEVQWHSSETNFTVTAKAIILFALRWRHNDHDGVSNHQPRGCLLNRLFGRRSKKTSKLRVTGLCEGNSPGPVNSPHKGPVTRKMFPFDDVIMKFLFLKLLSHLQSAKDFFTLERLSVHSHWHNRITGPW